MLHPVPTPPRTGRAADRGPRTTPSIAPGRRRTPAAPVGPVRSDGSAATSADRPTNPVFPAGNPTYGVPPEMLHRAWTIQDVMAFTGLGRTAAYRLMQQPAAPARLNTGGAHRWNGAQVLAFLHQPPDDTRASEPTPQAPGDQATDHSADGRALRSLTVDMVARSTGTTPDGIATFVVEPSAVAGAARRARVAALLAPASGHTHRSDEKASA